MVTLRLHPLESRIGQFSRIRLCIRLSSDDQWSCETIRNWSLASRLDRLGVRDPRDMAEISQQLEAAAREWGINACVEFSDKSGVSRYQNR